MRKKTNVIVSCVLGALAMSSPGAVHAAELTVLTSQGVGSAVRDLAPAFEGASGHPVIVSFQAGPSLMNKDDAKAPADLLNHYPSAIDGLIKHGKVTASTRTA